MRNIIAGTAGHIDHGKTALVRALTGIDTDRLKEEKKRGISIELGFAHMEAGGVRFGFVDVPGHERFVRNMLAGAGGIDLVVLVIAADESVKPQTREHFDICRLLGVEGGVVALTKADLVDADLLELARMEAVEFVAGSFLEDAPVVAVSSRTGAGLEELKAALVRVAGGVRQRSAGGSFRMPVDRAFVMKGFGTVVTGTVWGGQLAVEDEVELYPTGKRLRVRGLQLHGGPVERVEAGQRAAVNLAGVEVAEVSRGMALGPPGWFRPSKVVDVSFRLLDSAKPLKHRAPVHFHAGTAETEAEVRLLDGRNAVEPGETAVVRLLLKEHLLLLPGDRFIARMFSPVTTIGGGEIADNHPPLRLRKPAALARLKQLAGLDPRGRLIRLVGEAARGVTVADLVARSGIGAATVRQWAKEAGAIEVGNLVVAREPFGVCETNLRAALSLYHQKHPLEAGMPRTLAGLDGPLLDAVVAANAEIVADGELLRLSGFKRQLKEEEDEAAKKMESLFADAGLEVPPVNDALKASGIDANRARTLLQFFLRQKTLIRVSSDLIFHVKAIEALKAEVAKRRGESFGVGEFKEWTGVSRKYAIPLLEFLDRERVTRREGDRRVVLG